MTLHTRREGSPFRLRLSGLAALALAVAAQISVTASAQEGSLASKQVRIVVGFTPGGSVDSLARAVGDSLQKSSGATVVVENKPGAGGNIAASYVAKSSGDTINLLVTSTNHYANKVLFRDPGYDAYKDFIPINHLSNIPYAYVVRGDSSFNTLKDFVARGRAEPGRFSWAFGGYGTLGQFLGMALEKSENFKGIPVAYKGGPDLLTAVLGKQVDMAIMTLQSALPLIKQGKLKAVAVTGTTRNKALPEIAPVVEQIAGHPHLEAYAVLMASSNTPALVLAQLQREVDKALSADAFQKRLEVDGSTLTKFKTVADAKTYFDKDGPLWEALTREAGLKVE